MSLLTAERFSFPVTRICTDYLIEDPVSTLGFLAALEEENGPAYSFATYVIKTVLPSNMPRHQKERFIKATLLYALNNSALDLAARCIATFNAKSKPETRLIKFEGELTPHFVQPEEFHALKNMCGGCRLVALDLFPKLFWPSCLIPLLDSLDQPSFVTEALADERIIPPENYWEAIYTLTVAAICRGITHIQLPTTRPVAKDKNHSEVQANLNNLLTNTNIILACHTPGKHTQVAWTRYFIQNDGACYHLRLYNVFDNLAACGDSVSVKTLIELDGIYDSPEESLNFAISYGDSRTVQTLLAEETFANSLNLRSFHDAISSQNNDLLQAVLAKWNPSEPIFATNLITEIEVPIRNGNSEMLRQLMALPEFAAIPTGTLSVLTELTIGHDYVAVAFLLLHARSLEKTKLIEFVQHVRSVPMCKMLMEHPLFNELTPVEFSGLLGTISVDNPKVFELLLAHPLFKKVDALFLQLAIRSVPLLEILQKDSRFAEINPVQIGGAIHMCFLANFSNPEEENEQIALTTALSKTPQFEKISPEGLTKLFNTAALRVNPKWLAILTQSPRFPYIDLTKIGESVVELARKGAVDKLTLLLAHPHTKQISPLFIEEALKATQDPTIQTLLTSVKK